MSFNMTTAPAEVTTDDAESPQRRQSSAGGRHFARFSGVYVLIGFIVVYALWVPETFLTRITLQSILGDQAITGIITIGVVIGLAAGVFDLSFASNISLSGIICGVLIINHGWPIPAAIAVAIFSGVVVGLVNAFFVVKIGINSIVVTLGTSSLLAAVTSWLTNGTYLTGFPKGFTNIAIPKPLGIPILAVMLAVIALIGWYVLEHSPLGRRLQATGLGPEAARLAGVNTARMTVFALLAIAVTSSIAGVLIAAKINSATPDVGAAYLLPVIAGAMLGTTQIKPGRFSIAGTVLAIFLLATGVKGLQLAGGGQAWITSAFNGAALLLAVTFAALGERNVGGFWRRFRLRRRVSETASSETAESTR
ncbi:monosaccharide ABC transporter membrane protein (CUT2 family) [Antricoccus suffuscus]|uniref:Monosaccharide ABC transporter membrane protein (CUT2 family) n=1 Tax=Antricoccus suffuscus TaxID=1629062 RepID=A0A2T0ZTM4_9ACTN|nr:ABC transporter permease [Antricoccus suffuscus]PRZ39709.1 monosaccharide ABC transporter membrane protein (CUT2 family) [Antricoccus suffuscus]